MKINIQSLHFTAPAELNNFVLDKVNKLEEFDHKIVAGQVCLKLDKSTTLDNKVCEIRLEVPGNDLFAKKQSTTFEEATTLAVKALEHQMEKTKSIKLKKIKNKSIESNESNE